MCRNDAKFRYQENIQVLPLLPQLIWEEQFMLLQPGIHLLQLCVQFSGSVADEYAPVSIWEETLGLVLLHVNQASA